MKKNQAKRISIYVLTDPRVRHPVGGIRYVGQTKTTLRARLGRMRSGSSGKLRDWIEGLAAKKLRPEIRLVKKVQARLANQEETRMATRLARRGARLLNERRAVSPVRSASTLASKRTQKAWRNPQFRESVLRAIRSRAQSTGFRRRMADFTRALWKDPEYRRRQRASRHSAPYRTKVKRKWARPGFRAKCGAALRRAWRDPVRRARRLKGHAARIRRAWQAPAARAHLRAAVRRLWRDPQYRARWWRARWAGRTKSH